VVKKKSPKITSAAFSVSIRGQAGKNSWKSYAAKLAVNWINAVVFKGFFSIFQIDFNVTIMLTFRFKKKKICLLTYKLDDKHQNSKRI
jgi:aromatic ring-opening dioxygenase LigB subunit